MTDDKYRCIIKHTYTIRAAISVKWTISILELSLSLHPSLSISIHLSLSLSISSNVSLQDDLLKILVLHTYTYVRLTSHFILNKGDIFYQIPIFHSIFVVHYLIWVVLVVSIVIVKQPLGWRRLLDVLDILAK